MRIWRLQAWLGHKRIDETMRYVHVAESHGRELPTIACEAGNNIIDPAKCVIAMLGARGSHVAADPMIMDQSATNSAA